MKVLSVVYGYLKRYPFLAAAILGSIIGASLFEGASFGMLIPITQSFMNAGSSLFDKAQPIIKFIPGLSSMKNEGLLTLLFIIMFLIISVKNLFVYMSNVLTAKLRFSVIRDLTVEAMDRVIEYDMKYFDNVKTGYLITNINNETVRIGDLVLATLRFVAVFGKVAAYVAILLLISLKISVFIFVSVIIVLLPLEFLMKKVKKFGYRISQTTREYNYKLMEILSGIRVIRISGTEQAEKENFRKATNEVYKMHYGINKLIHLLIPVSEVVVFGLITASFLFLLRVVRIDVVKTFPFIAAYLVVLVRALTQLNLLNSLRSEAVNSIAAFVNYTELCDEKDKKTIKGGDRVIEKFSRSITFRDVCFSYVDGKPVLSDIDIDIQHGKMTALVGMSGAGKTTIVNLMLRFYDVGSGSIAVDGTDLRSLDLGKWRRKIGFVSQDIFIFNTTVKDNISYGHPHIREGDVIDACKKAHCHEFIMELPQGYDSILGERGVKLSGGQKQRISIARAIIHDPEILILDEATSSLDSHTERLIREAISGLTKDRTVIAIAHRLSTVVGADNIVVLDKGRVVENGQHADLMKTAGLYKRLYDVQSSAETESIVS